MPHKTPSRAFCVFVVHFVYMRIFVKAKTDAKIVFVKEIIEPVSLFSSSKPKSISVYTVSVKEPAVDGKANKAIIQALAKHFGIAPSLVTLVSGATAKQKIFEIGV